MNTDFLDTHLMAYLSLREALGFQMRAEKIILPEFVAYLLAADMVARLPSCRLSDDHQPGIMTRNRVSTPRLSLFPSLCAHPSRSIPRSSTGILC